MNCLVYAGSYGDWAFTQTLIITTGNTGRQITMLIKQKFRPRSTKFITNTMAPLVIGAWLYIWSAKAVITVSQRYINIWIQSWDYVLSSVWKSRITTVIAVRTHIIVFNIWKVINCLIKLGTYYLKDWYLYIKDFHLCGWKSWNSHFTRQNPFQWKNLHQRNIWFITLAVK